MWGRIVAAMATAALILGAAPAQAAIQNEFISTWDTENTSTFSSDYKSLKLPIHSGGTYNFWVDWGDGTPAQNVTSWLDATHTYAVAGEYTLHITGTFNGFQFNGVGDRLKLLNVSKWGPLALGNGGHYFSGAENMTITATDAPDLSSTTTLYGAFSDAKALTGGISNWNTGTVTDLSYAFDDASKFNGDLNWDTSQVTRMVGTFQGALAFNGDIGSWNTGNVEYMNECFYRAHAFNRDIGDWDVRKVISMMNMFYTAYAFNQDIGRWQTDSLLSTSLMFTMAYAFNQDISAWNTSHVTDMSGVFQLARAFNQDISAWNTANVTTMEGAFAGASAFNQNLGGWDVRKVTNMSQMMRDSGLRPLNYDKTLIAWAAQDVKNSVAFWGNSKYASDAAVTARAHLTGTHLWNISDGGRVPVPVAPSAVTTTPGDRRISVTWTDTPAANYVPVDHYTATASPGGQSCTAVSSGCTLEGLTNGQAYTVTVTATSAAGTGSPSPATAEVVPIATASAPQSLNATPGHRQVAVTWEAPADLGGGQVLNYLVRAEPGGATCTTTGMTCTIDQLDNATTYRVTVHATTAAGPGQESAVTATTEPAWIQTASPKVAKRVKPTAKTVLLRTAVTTNAGQRATAKVRVKRQVAKVRITKRGRVVLLRKTQRPFTVTLRLSAPATADHGPYSFTHRWRAR